MKNKLKINLETHCVFKIYLYLCSVGKVIGPASTGKKFENMETFKVTTTPQMITVEVQAVWESPMEKLESGDMNREEAVSYAVEISTQYDAVVERLFNAGFVSPNGRPNFFYKDIPGVSFRRIGPSGIKREWSLNGVAMSEEQIIAAHKDAYNETISIVSGLNNIRANY